MRKNHLLNYCLLSLAFLFLILPIGLASTTTQEPNLVKNMANSGEPIDMIRTAVSGSHLLLGDGNGNFNYVGWSDWIGGLGIALGDLNKDGLLDYVLATYDIPYGEPNVVCLGITDTSFDCAYIDDIYMNRVKLLPLVMSTTMVSLMLYSPVIRVYQQYEVIVCV